MPNDTEQPKTLPDRDGPSVDADSPSSPVVDREAVDTDKPDSQDAKRDIAKDA